MKWKVQYTIALSVIAGLVIGGSAFALNSYEIPTDKRIEYVHGTFESLIGTNRSFDFNNKRGTPENAAKAWAKFDKVYDNLANDTKKALESLPEMWGTEISKEAIKKDLNNVLKLLEIARTEQNTDALTLAYWVTTDINHYFKHESGEYGFTHIKNGDRGNLTDNYINGNRYDVVPSW